jgi:hypothetical protein
VYSIHSHWCHEKGYTIQLDSLIIFVNLAYLFHGELTCILDAGIKIMSSVCRKGF